jgi:hypothetical protein
MNGTDAEQEQRLVNPETIPPSPYTEARKTSVYEAKVVPDDNEKTLPSNKKKKSSGRSFINFIYDSRRKTVLGRSSLNWGKIKI